MSFLFPFFGVGGWNAQAWAQASKQASVSNTVRYGGICVAKKYVCVVYIWGSVYCMYIEVNSNSHTDTSLVLLVLEVELRADGGRDLLVLELLQHALVTLVALAEDVLLEPIDCCVCMC